MHRTDAGTDGKQAFGYRKSEELQLEVEKYKR